MKLPSCKTDHPETEILSAAASIAGKRQTPHAGRGRPKGQRCPKCGKVPSRCKCEAQNG